MSDLKLRRLFATPVSTHGVHGIRDRLQKRGVVFNCRIRIGLYFFRYQVTFLAFVIISVVWHHVATECIDGFIFSASQAVQCSLKAGRHSSSGTRF